MIKKTLFGNLSDGREVFLYSLKNKSSTVINIINYGAIVTNLYIKDKNGKIDDVVLGYDSLEGYINDKSFLGAIVGRCANRINKGRFKLNGNDYQLTINDGENHLHGGPYGFCKKLWDADFYQNESDASVKLTYVSNDIEEGYPGKVTLIVIYTLTEDNQFRISYEGFTNKPTILNPTHHSYFNLTGDFTKKILDHLLSIDADKFTPINKNLVPTGKLLEVKETPMDFRTLKPINQNINENYDQLEFASGYDHNWVLNNYNFSYRKAASLYDPQTGRCMEVFTDQPGLQFYSGNFLDGTINGKNEIIYESRTAICLEAQHFPDSPNNPAFPSVSLNPGETYAQTTTYKFSIL